MISSTIMKKQKKEKKRKNEIHHSNRFGTFPTNKTITRESLIPRRIPSFCNYFSITTECNQLQHETLILLFLLMHMTEKIVKTHFTSNILRHTGVVWQWPFISCHDVVSDRIFFMAWKKSPKWKDKEIRFLVWYEGKLGISIYHGSLMDCQIETGG